MLYQIELLYEQLLIWEKIDPTMFWAVIISVLVAIGITIYFVWKHIAEKQLEFVKKTSARYKALLELNNSFDFYENLRETYYEYFRVNSKAKFDRFNFDSNMKAEISKGKDYYKSILKQIKYNKKEYKKYLEKLNYLPMPTSEVEGRISIRRYQQIEDKLYYSNLLQPIVDVTFYADLRYTSPKGRNSYHTRYHYMPRHIERLMDDIKKEKDFKASKDYQRSIMTDSLRYDVMKSDGFRCVLCGRTAKDGAQLHVDHIKPIAKGGKTVRSNLRTLCDQCNLGKSDKWDAYGCN